MNFLDRTIFNQNLNKLNSITKYPSILTYHNLGPKGSLVDSLVEDKNFDDTKVYITEKIDGTNSRIVFFTNENGAAIDYLIGSREELLFAKNDRIINPALGVVNVLKPIADKITVLSGEGDYVLKPNSIFVLYGETYGGNINGYKQYTTKNSYSIRFFDAMSLSYEEAEEIYEFSPDRISTWRENGGQKYFSVLELSDFCSTFELTMVPYLVEMDGTDIPNKLQEVWDWMQVYATSIAGIDIENGCSEGIVVRTENRSLIRKIRFQDYQRTKKIGLIK